MVGVYLPDGQNVTPPVDPRTWTDASAGVLGDPLRAPLLEHDAGGAVMWNRQRPLFQGAQYTAQSIPASTFTAITALSEIIDNYSGHSDTANTGRYYPPTTYTSSTQGDWYLVTGIVPFNSTGATANVFSASLRITGSATIIEGGKLPGGAGHFTVPMVIDLVQMGGFNPDYVELMARQTTAAAVNTVVAGKVPTLTVRWVCINQAVGVNYTPPLPAAPHVWADTDIWAGSATGGGKVPANTEVRDLVRYLNNPPIVRLTSQGTTQTIPNGGVWTSLQFPTATVDNYGGWSSGANTRYTCQRAGLYFVAGTAAVGEVSGAGGSRAVRLLVNGATVTPGLSMLPQTAGTSGSSPMAMAHLRLNVGDYVEFQMWQTSTSALTVGSGAGNSARMIAVWTAK